MTEYSNTACSKYTGLVSGSICCDHCHESGDVNEYIMEGRGRIVTLCQGLAAGLGLRSVGPKLSRADHQPHSKEATDGEEESEASVG